MWLSAAPGFRQITWCAGWSSLSNRAFSMAMTAWAAKFVSNRDLLVGEGKNFSTVDSDNSNQVHRP